MKQTYNDANEMDCGTAGWRTCNDANEMDCGAAGCEHEWCDSNDLRNMLIKCQHSNTVPISVESDPTPQ